MVDFVRGATLSLSLDADDLVTFNGTASLKVTSQAGNTVESRITGTQTLGPYKQSVTLAITCDTAGSYTTVSSPSFAFPAVWNAAFTALQNPLTGVDVQLGGASDNPVLNLRNLSTTYSAYSRTRTKLAAVKAGTGSLKVACIGDSTEVGSWANGVENVNNRIWCPAVAAALAMNSFNYPATDSSFWGDQNMGVRGSTIDAYDPRVTLTGGWASSVGGSCPGAKQIANSTTTTAFSFLPQEPVDTFDVWMNCDTGTGTFSMSRTGDTSSGTLSTIDATGPIPKKFTFTGALGMANALNIQRVTGFIGIMGIDAYNSAKPSVRFWNQGWSSGVSADVSATVSGTNALSALSYMLPDLVYIAIGINDWRNGVALATFTANVQKMITQILPYADIILVTPLPSTNSVVAYATQKTFADAVIALGVTNGLLVQDSFNKVKSAELRLARGDYTDTIHPSKVLYSPIGEARALQLLAIGT